MRLNKRLTSGALALLMAVSPTIPYNVFNDNAIIAEAAETYTDAKGIVWNYGTLENGTLQITKVTTPSNGVDLMATVPNTIDGVTVTKVGDYAFQNISNIKTIALNQNITHIGAYAFHSCSVSTFANANTSQMNYLPSSITSIGNDAFGNCRNLKELTIVSNITTQGSGIFSNSGLTSIILPSDLTYIGSGMFYQCTSLKNITIPDTVKTIGSEAFNRCTSLTNINIPSKVTTLNNGVFAYCTSLTEITIPDGVTAINESAFEYCTKLTNIEMSDSVKSIEKNAFKQCTVLENIDVSSNLESLGNNAFDSCTSLKEIELPNSLTSLGHSAFYCCSQLTNITLSDNITVLPTSLFQGCVSLNNVVIPENVTTIEMNAFTECKALTNIIIPENVTTIKDSAFYGCASLRSIVIPDSVTFLGSCVFTGCIKLKNATLPTNITSIKEQLFNNCSSLEEITIPSKVTSIRSAAFCNCSSLKKISIPENVTSIGSQAFKDCRGLTEINIPKTISLGESSFEGCINLLNIELPENLTVIPNRLFFGCSSLEEIAIPNSVTKFGSYAFASCTSLTSINIPSNLTTVGSGLFEGCSLIKEVHFPNTVTSIGHSVFKECISIEEVTLPEGIPAITESMFYNCSKLESVNIPESVKEIHRNAFYNCNKLRGINIPQYLTYIGEYAFYKCYGITELVLPETLTTLYSNAFFGCTSIKNIVIPSGIKNIEPYTFQYCSSLESVTLPEGLKTISQYAFAYCSKLKEVNIPEGVTTIGENAFFDCKSLTKVVIPDSVTSINMNTFRNCPSIIFHIHNNPWIKSYATNNQIGLKHILSNKYADIIISQSGLTYNGIALQPEITVMYDDVEMSADDYDITYSNNVDAGKGLISVTGKNSYDGTVTAEFDIEQSEITEVILFNETYVYDGTAKEPSVTVKCGDITLTANDYDISYENNVNIGTATVTITGKGNFTGTITKNFAIVEKGITDVILSETEFKFDGEVKEPSVTVKCEDDILDDEYYTVEYSDNVNAGTATVVITAKGNYGGVITKTFTINPANITSVTLDADSFVYSGTSIEPQITVNCDDAVLTTDDYDVTYSDNVNVGTVTVTITGKNNYKGTITKTFEITPIIITSMELSDSEFTYDGTEKNPSVTIKYGEEILDSEHYTVEYTGNINAGEGKAIVTAKGNYSGVLENTFIINSANITSMEITDNSFIYNGTEIKPAVIVNADDIILTTDDYEITYSDNVNAGTGSITVTAKDNFTGTITKTFEIAQADITSVELDVDSFIYDGTSKEPNVIVKTGDIILSENDYDVSYENNIEIGTGNVIVTAKGNFKGTITESFEITDKGVTDIELSDIEFIYDGTEKKPNIIAKDDEEIIDENYYIVEYSNNINVGTATVTVKGQNGYGGVITKTFTINPANITSVVLKTETYIYNGSEIKPEVTVNSDALVLSADDYDIIYENNINVGTASVIITAKGNYQGTLTKDYTIAPANITSATLNTGSFVYDGTAKKPVVTVKSEDKILVIDKDYTVSYNNNIEAGTATVFITGKGNFKGTITKTFAITKQANDNKPSDTNKPASDTNKPTNDKPANNKPSVDDPVANDKNNTVNNNSTTSTTISIVKGLKQKASYKTNAVTLTWSKVSGATGYEVYRATTKNGKYKKIGTTTKTSFTNKSLKAGTKYYYKIRAIKKTSTSTTYSKYTSVLTAQTKVKAPTIKKITKSKNKAFLKLTKAKGAKGYVVYVKVGKKFIKKATVKKPTATIKNIKRNRKYTFKVKAYSVIKDKKVYSVMSKAKRK